MKFSLCMIVKNESAILRNCLDSLKEIMDEIIIVDTGSTDDTKQIAAEYTPYVYDFEWNDDLRRREILHLQKQQATISIQPMPTKYWTRRTKIG